MKALATGVGSWPGEDPFEAARIIAGELADLPALPELPARGPGADLVGRSLSLLPELHAEVVPSGWRLTSRPGRDGERARAWLRQDLDAFEEATAQGTGSIKVQLAGPWTLAASVELPSGQRAVADHGARRDLVLALAEAAHDHVTEVARRWPGRLLVLQVDEPLLDAVLHGAVPTASGFRTLRHVDQAEVVRGLASVVERVGDRAEVWAHSCGREVPWTVLLEAGLRGLSFDLGLLRTSDYDTLAAAAESGVQLVVGAVPTSPRLPVPLLEDVARVRGWWHDMGLAASTFSTHATVSPTCGLAGLSPAKAREAISRSVELARAMMEDPDGDHVRLRAQEHTQ